MKKLSFIICLQLWIILFLASISGQDFKTIRDGIEYAEMTRRIDEEPVRINFLRLDLTKTRIDVVHAMDAAIGTETVSSIAKRHGAFAAINAGFFRLDKSIFAGDCVGALMIDKKVLSESYANRATLLIRNEPKKTVTEFLYLNLNVLVEIGNAELTMSGINRERKNDELILFTPEFNRTTLTDTEGSEIIVKNGRIIKVSDNSGSNLIPGNGFVLSASGKSREKLLKLAKIGTKVSVSQPIQRTTIGESQVFLVSEFEDAVSGVPQLIKNGKIHITWKEEKTNKAFVDTKHPRTAVAKLDDGKFLLVTADGRSESSGGISLRNLAEILLEIGATDAINFDGGGSTTMFLDGKTVNQPSDKEGERKVSDALLVFPRKIK